VPKEVFEALEIKDDAGTSEIVATIRALKQGAGEHEKLVQKVAALEMESAERTKAELVAKAIKEGKITPAQKEWADEYALEDPKGFEVFIAKAPVIVPVDKRIVGDKPAKSEAGLDETQLMINKMMGIKKETWEKYNPKPTA
jgi:phage I-like protein